MKAITLRSPQVGRVNKRKHMSDERKTNLAKLNDGLENIVSGMGTSIDPTTHNYWRSIIRILDPYTTRCTV